MSNATPASTPISRALLHTLERTLEALPASYEVKTDEERAAIAHIRALLEGQKADPLAPALASLRAGHYGAAIRLIRALPAASSYAAPTVRELCSNLDELAYRDDVDRRLTDAQTLPEWGMEMLEECRALFL